MKVYILKTKKNFIFLADFNKKEFGDSKILSVFKNSRHESKSVLVKTQVLFESLKRTVKANVRRA